MKKWLTLMGVLGVVVCFSMVHAKTHTTQGGRGGSSKSTSSESSFHGGLKEKGKIPPPLLNETSRQSTEKTTSKPQSAITYEPAKKNDKHKKPTFQFPLKNHITTPYYFGQDTWYNDFHIGQDYRAPMETKLYAPYDGHVKFIRGNDAGNYIEFRPHGVPYVLRFLHLDKVLKTGEVKKGDKIALTGDTGLGGAHLHMDISKGNNVQLYNRGNFVSPEKPQGFKWKFQEGSEKKKKSSGDHAKKDAKHVVKAEKAAKEAKETAEKEAKERAAKELKAKEKAEKAAKEAKEKAEKAAKEAKAKAEKAAKEAKEKAEKEAKAAKEKAEKEAKERAKAEKEAKERAEKAAKQAKAKKR